MTVPEGTFALCLEYLVTMQRPIDELERQNLQAVAAAVYVAVTGDVDHPDGGNHPVSQVSGVDALKEYVERFLDGYQVTPESLAAAVSEGVALSEATLKELISQASAAGLDVEEFFADGEFDIEAGLSAAASHDPGSGERERSVRERVFDEWRRADNAGEWVIVSPGDVHSTFGVHEIARSVILDRGLPVDTPYIGWGRDRDTLRPDGTFAKGEDHQQVFWRGDAEKITNLLRKVESLGYVIEGGENGAPFRLVCADDASSTEPFALVQRDDLLSDRHEIDLGSLRYATSWVEKTKLPKSDADNLSEDEARELFDDESPQDLYVFPSGADGELPAWSMKLRPRKKSAVVTHFHDPSGSVARIVEFEYTRVFTDGVPGGSLLRDTVTGYLWPEEHVKYAAKTRAIAKVALGDSSGTPVITREDRLTGATTTTKHRGGSAEGRISYPAFGAWGPLVDPRFGEVEGGATSRRVSDSAWGRMSFREGTHELCRLRAMSPEVGTR